jgi:hypothetical protein
MIEHDLEERVMVEIAQDGLTTCEELPYEQQLIRYYGRCGHESGGILMNGSLA